MEIGEVELDNPVILAPMAGVTDLPFRRIVKEFGCGLVCTEMISAKGLVYNSPRTEELLTISKKERPVSMQIFGTEPEIMAEAVEKIKEYRPDIIDINLGCPTPKIVKGGAGSALMKDPELVGRIVTALVETTSIPITVKMRKGWDEEHVNAVEVAQIAEESGAQAVAVHGRTREQFYKGEADWEVIKEVKEAVEVPVIGNGDIFGPQDAEDMINITGCDGVMIARGAQGNPWIFKRTLHYLKTGELLPLPTPKERINMVVRHLEALVDYKGEYVAVREMRRHTVQYIKGLYNCTEVKQEVNQAETAEELKEILHNYRREFME